MAITGHPQGTFRGLRVSSALAFGNSTGTATATPYASGVTFDGGLRVSGKTVGTLTANSTGLLVADALRVGTKATYITSNSTGVKLGNKYISTNTTGN